MPQIDVRTYEQESGVIPFDKWVSKLRDRRAMARIVQRIKRVQEGNLGATSSVGGGVHELKIDYGPGYRVYFGREGDEIVILLCGGTKATQSGDIATAKAYWADYEARKAEAEDSQETDHGKVN